ncbi:MAG: lytic transglycosylase, partial [Oscillochloris sp.]|nr:lytic transglycosylase [Oscillochloris sp.]
MAARLIGDDEAAGTDLSTLLQIYPGAAEARQARFFLAESFARRERWTSAAELLRPFVEESVDDALRAPAIFWLARSYEAAGDYAAAVATYQRYRDLGTLLQPYAALRQAAQYEAAGQLAEAATAYEYAARTDIVRGERAGSFERAIRLRQQLGSPEAGLDLYDELLALAETPTYRASLFSQAAALAQEIGQGNRAGAWLRQLVTEAPGATQAAAAADQLLAAGDPALSATAAGKIFFEAERWPDAVAQFDQAIAQGGDLEAGVELR